LYKSKLLVKTISVIIFALLMQACSNLNGTGSQETTTGTVQSNNSLKGNWKDEAAKKTYTFSDTEMIVCNQNNVISNQATYTIDKDILTAKYSKYHGLLIDGDLIEKFKLSFTQNGCDLTPIDDAGLTGTTIKLVK